jgi:penicillin-binding protein 1A
MRIEETLSKERILELYLNEIYLGMGSYGVAAAAQSYFNKPLEKLSLSEAAFLAALPKAPNNYNPFRYPDAAKARRDWVIDRMAEDRVIPAAQAAAAKAEAIVPAEFRRPQPIPGADWFAEEVRRELIARFGADVTTQGGLMVRTSLDPELQLTAEKAVRNGLMAYDRKMGGWRGPVSHLDGGTALAKDWTGPLAQVPRPPGMLPDWRLAVVLDETDSEARLGWLETAGQTPQQIGSVPLSDLAWARPIKDGKPGGAPRRMADIVQPGDVVMIERVAAATQPKPGDPRAAKLPAVALQRVALR